MSVRSTTLARWTVVSCGLTALAASYWYFARNSARLEGAGSNVRSCEQIAAQIEQVRQAPRKARLTTRSSEDWEASWKRRLPKPS